MKGTKIFGEKEKEKKRQYHRERNENLSQEVKKIKLSISEIGI